jgi:ABC-type oligopeptide transport system ATPase subunit
MSTDVFYKVLLVGSSGKGKTFSARNLDRATTGFINVENKPLPFKGSFEKTARPKTHGEAYQSLIDFGRDSEITSIFFDSFSAYNEMVLSEARKTKKGFDIWSMYNDEIGKLLDLIKRVPKPVFITAHYEILGVEGNMEKRVKVKAREWEG